MAGDLAGRFLESQKKSEAILERLKEETLSYEAFRDRLEAYILARLVLPDTEREKNLYQLAVKSIRALAPKGAEEQAVLDRIAKPDCHNTSSAVQKKVLLIMGIEKRLGVTLPEGEELPGTTEELAHSLYRCLGERRGGPGGLLRKQFPILAKGELCYLDNAATTQKPDCVLQELDRYYREDNANVYRGGYRLAIQSEQRYEQARQTLAGFLCAESEEIIFTGGTTAGINLVAYGYCAPRLKPGKNIVITALEHNSNCLPWREACRRSGAQLRIIPLKEGRVDLEAARFLVDENTVLTACTLCSNLSDVAIPVRELIGIAHGKGKPVLLDAAQAAGHIPIDCRALDAEFLCFSGHKVYGPMGIGVLYAKRRIQAEMDVFLTGGGMTEETAAGPSYLDGPRRFESGTPDVAGAVGLARAVLFLQEIGMERIRKREAALKAYAREQLLKDGRFFLPGDGSGLAPIVSFHTEVLQDYDIAAYLAAEGICVRSGRHCAPEALRQLGIPGCVRASFALYNTEREIDRMLAALETLLRRYGKGDREHGRKGDFTDRGISAAGRGSAV